MSKFRFKTCRLLFKNVWKRKPTKIQKRILRRLKRKNKSFQRNLYSRINRNSYIQSQTTRKLSLFHGNLPITKMHRRRKESIIPFLLNLERRLDIILVRIHFRETLPQARQPISHRKVCVNNRMVNRTHFKVSHGDLISFQDNAARIRRPKIRRSFFCPIIKKRKKKMKILCARWARRARRDRRGRKVRWARRDRRAHLHMAYMVKEKKGKERVKEKKGKGKKKVETYFEFCLKIKLQTQNEIQRILTILNNMDRPVRMGRRTKTQWFQGKTKEEDSLLPQKRFFQKCLKTEKNKNNLRMLRFDEKKRDEKKKKNKMDLLKNWDSLLSYILSNTRTPPLSTSTEKVDSIFSVKWCSDSDAEKPKHRNGNFIPSVQGESSELFFSDEEIKQAREEEEIRIIETLSHLLLTRNKKMNKKMQRKRQIKKKQLPTHYSEVNHRTSKAVVSYRPNIGHIPHHIKMKDLNLLLRIGNKCG